MHKHLPWLISALLGASIASMMTWQMIQKPKLDHLTVKPTTHSTITQADSTTTQTTSPTTSAPISFASAIEKAAPAVVNFYSTSAPAKSTVLENLPGSAGLSADKAKKTKAVSLGSGVILDQLGFLITNHHVIEDAFSIRAVLHDGRDLPAEVLGHDPDTDLAVLKIDAQDLPAITIAKENKTNTGDVVLAIGYPYGLGQAVSMGIVSAVGRSGLNLSTFEDFIQTDAAINRGSSGGALINTQGEIIGISTAILTESGGSQGIGFAIPAHLALSVMEALIEDGRVKRGWLGILPEPLDLATAKDLNLPPNTGILVKAIAPHTPASKAGFMIGDIIVKVGAEVVGNQYQALKAVASQPPGSMVDISILRDAKPLTLQVEVAERPQNTSASLEPQLNTTKLTHPIEIQQPGRGLPNAQLAQALPQSALEPARQLENTE